MANSSTARVKELRAREKAKGRARREYYATPGEHEQIRVLLKSLRK